MLEVTQEHIGIHNRKFGIRLEDDSRVEAVLYRGDSLCISTQVGCAVGCPFCASGARGLGRNLNVEELHGQVACVLAKGHKIARVTLSGVGEPLHNQEACLRFVRESHEAKRTVSLTSSGGPLRRLEAWFQVPHRGLTLSVHAGSEKMRSQVVPRGPALGPLFDELQRLLPTATQRRRRRVALAYLMLGGLNDHDEEIDAFIERALPLGLVVHLFRYNPVPTSDHTRVPDPRYQEVCQRMRSRGLEVRRSSQARIEATGGCGTLVALRAPRPAS